MTATLEVYMDISFGERLARAMRVKKMKQKDLSKSSGVTEATISRYVNDKRHPDVMFLRKVVPILGVSADYLLGFTDEPEPPYPLKKARKPKA